MILTTRILPFLPLFICFLGNVDATIEIFDAFGRHIDKFQDREAPLDEDIQIMEGFITLTDPPDACEVVAEPTFLTNFTYGKFALINGTEICGYNRKIHNAGRAGYDFAVIFDPISGPAKYLNFGFEPHIPAVLMSYEDGLIIKNNYLYNNSSIFNYRIRVKPNIPDLSYYMYLFGAVIGICFFVMILFIMCLLIKCIQERRKSRRNRLSSRQIKQIPTAKFTKGDQYDVCAICLEDYNEGDKLRILPCSHAYHAKCIDPWLMNNRRNCPLCKRKITFGDSGDESDSEDSELTSPAENTPLLASPSNRSPAWGTFVNPVRTPNDSGGPSSMPNDFICTENSPYQASQPVAFENWLASDSESECLLPPSQFSVNNEKIEPASNQTEVQVNFVSPNEGEASSSRALTI
jgi:hypothetical protein